MACVLEATARKPGNVHPESSFHNLSYGDFVKSAAIVAPVLAQTTNRGVGATVLRSVAEMRREIPRNSNLGIVLLLAPLAGVPVGVRLQDGIDGVLDALTVDDSVSVYEAIRLASPGGLGRADREDVASQPTVTLREAMRLAADRDMVAAQYATRFAAVFKTADRLSAGGQFPDRWEEAVIGLHLSLMAEYPDTLIARKCGIETARESSERAAAVLASDWPKTAESRRMMSEFDAWLRADGNRRNPGTTADLVAAALFVALRDGGLKCPPMPAGARAFLSPSVFA
jgi:triphosphoribosyl-dephospho-CoA synthase